MPHRAATRTTEGDHLISYITAPDLWDPATEAALRAVLLQLTPGQRIRCGAGRCSVFAGVSQAGTVYAVHYVPGRGYDWRKFHALRMSLLANAESTIDPLQRAQELARFALSYRDRFPDLADTAWQQSKVITAQASQQRLAA
jgi:hypothetical protein